MNTSKAHDAFIIARTKNYNAGGSVRDSGPASGWILDNRGGFPKSTVEEGYGTLNDVSDKFGTALIRPINNITQGVITVETGLVTGGNGVSVEFRDANDSITYKIKLIDNSWCILSKEESYDVILKDAFSQNNDTFSFRIAIDLDNRVSYTFINDSFCGEHPLLSDSAENFRFATDEESVIAVTPTPLLMYANYHVFEDFSRFAPLSVYGWECSEGVRAEGEETVIDTGFAKKTFRPVCGSVSFQCHFKNKFADNTVMSLCGGGNALINIEYKDNTLYGNGKELYKCRFSDMWHRLRIDADTNTGTANILLNGRKMGSITFEKGKNLDSLVLESKGGISNFDFIKLYNTVEHDDYVPEPLSKANTDDYIVGMNICSMWVNGNHFGWSVVSPYKEHEPYLGFYDEGNPETADWEIKYMVERGIDYQAFCWYGGFSNGYLKNPYLSDQLHEGFQYAKYSDRMYYTIMWETWMKVMSMEQFKTITVPYWFENYFLDDRYLKIDNKIVFYVYAPQSLKMDNLFGSVEAAREALQFMDDTAKSFGYDGMIFIESGVYNAGGEDKIPVKAMGFDASVCYHWFGNGYLPEHNISNITIAECNKQTHFIPTASSGYDGYVWRKKTQDPVRRPVATEEDMYKVCKWIKDEYLPKYKDEKESWKHKMVMFSTWNEYGEGTFIMPSGINGFGQLDAIDRAFSSGGAKQAVIPTPSQRSRINHLYPQNVTLLRRYGYYVKDSIADVQESVLCVYSPKEKTADGAVNYAFKSGRCDIHHASQLEIKLKGKVGTKVKISFTTAQELEFSDTKSFTVTIDSENEKIYSINTRENYRFGQSFITPPEQNRYSFSLIKLKAEADGCCDVTFGDITVRSLIGNGVVSKDSILIINGISPRQDIYPEKVNDRIYFPFDPDSGIDFMINSLIKYNRYKEELTISTTDHTAVFTRGQSTYILDGKEKDLGYTLWFTDGIPMFDFEKLSKDLGFEYSWNENTLNISAPQSCEFSPSDVSDHDFVFKNGMLHGWSSPQMSLLPGASSLTAKNAITTSDPQLYRYGTSFDAGVYTKLLLRIRYKHVRAGANQLEIYFDTNKAKGFCAERCIRVPLEVNDTGDNWLDFEVDLTAVGGWQDTITDLRLDPFTSSGQMEFEYIRFVKE